MINLIPKTAEKSIQVEYWIRVLSVWLVLLSITMVASAFILLPSYVLVSSQVEVYEETAAEAVQMVEDYRVISKDLIKSSQQAKYALDESGRQSFSELVYLFEELEGSGIEVNSLDISRGEEGIEPIMVGGKADNRVELAAFRDRILELESVDSVDLPISNLAKDKDISFKITVFVISNNTSS